MVNLGHFFFQGSNFGRGGYSKKGHKNLDVHNAVENRRVFVVVKVILL